MTINGTCTEYLSASSLPINTDLAILEDLVQWGIHFERVNGTLACFQYDLIRVKTKPLSMTDSKSLRKNARLVFSLSTSSRSSWRKIQILLKSFYCSQYKIHTFTVFIFFPLHWFIIRDLMTKQKWGHVYNIVVTYRGVNLVFSHLLETRHDVTRDGADQGRDVIHEALGEAVLPGWLQAIGEVQVVNNALHLRYRKKIKTLCCAICCKSPSKPKLFLDARMLPTISSKKNQACCRAPSLMLPLLTTHWRASSSWNSLNRQLKWKHMGKIMGGGEQTRTENKRRCCEAPGEQSLILE